MYRFIGTVEVGRQLEAHEQGHANGDVRVAAEVRINLQRVREQGHHALETRISHRVVEYPVDEVERDVVADHYFLHQTIQYPEHGQPEVPAAQLVRCQDLRDEGCGAHDGTRHQLREKTHEEPEVKDAAHRLDLVPVHVHRVTDGLEGEETDAHRKQDPVHHVRGAEQAVAPLREPVDLHVVGAERAIDVLDQEVRVLEVAQQQQVDRYAQGEPQPLVGQTCRTVDEVRDGEVADRAEEQDEHEEPAGLVVEEEAGYEEPGIANGDPLVYHGEAGQHHHEEAPEEQLREGERESLLVSEEQSEEGGELAHAWCAGGPGMGGE